MNARRPSLAALAPYVGLVLCMAAWAGQLTAATHESGVPHVRCAEHGELVDVGARTVASASALASADLTALGDADAVRPDDAPEAADGGHDHCALAGLADQASRAPRAPTIVLTRPAIRGPLDLVPADVPWSVPTSRLLRAAPKTSPPV